MYNLAQIATMNAKITGSRKLSNAIHIKQMERLKSHSDTVVATEQYQDVIDFVSIERKCTDLMGASVLTTTNRAIDDVIKYTEKEIKRIILNGESSHSETEVLMAINHSANTLTLAGGFFSIPTKEIFIVRNRDQRKDKTTNSDTKDKRPKRFSKKEWTNIKNRSILAHELFHMHMDVKSHSNNEMLHEEYAYTNMVGWCRKEGMKDKEIAKTFLIPFGGMLAAQKYPSIVASEQWSEFDKKAMEEAMLVIERYANRNGDTRTRKDINYQKRDVSFDIEL